MTLLMKVRSLLDGKKTYITAVAIGVLAALNYLDVEIPRYVYEALVAWGVIGWRSAVKKIERTK